MMPMPAASREWPCVRGYEFLSVIGSGGMGIVYKARHAELRRTVALKTLRGAAVGDAEFRLRFRAEAEAVARLQHPNIIQVFEVGCVDGVSAEAHSTPFIALEFVDGGNLTLHTSQPQSPRFAAEMVERLARAVDSAHRVGVIHRDLKPANVLLTRGGEPKIADFGVAKQLGCERDVGGRFLTQAGTVVGTPEYMASEQARGDAPTTAVDIHALGVILYELLTARVPFQAASPVETMTQVQRQEAVSPRHFHPDVPRDLETICLKCVEKEPGKRYATALELADDLRCYLDHRPIRARRVSEIEKVWRWSRRNPVVAGSLAAACIIFLAAFTLVLRSYWRAEAAWREEAKQRLEAQEKERAERWERYRAHIGAAAAALQAHNVDTAQSSLAEAPADYRNWEWRHFQSRLDLSKRTLRCEVDGRARAIVARDGSRAILAGESGFIRVWDVNAGREVRTINDVPELWGAAFTADGRTAVYERSDHAIALRDVEGERVTAVMRGHTDGIHTLNFTADNRRMLTASLDHSIRIWDTANGEQLRSFRPYDGASPAATALSPDGQRVVTSDPLRKDVRLLDADSGATIAELAGHAELQSIHFTPRGDRFVTIDGFPRNTLKLWDARDGKFIAEMRGHSNTVTQVAFSPDGTHIASSSMDQSVRLWEAATGKFVAVLKGHQGRATSTAFSPDGRLIVSGSHDQTARLWDAATGAPIAVLSGHTGTVTAVSFSADGKRVLSVSTDGTVRVRDPQMIESDGVLRGHGSFAYSVAFHPKGAPHRIERLGRHGANLGRDERQANPGARSR
jgi:WD40 repeat protein